MSKFNETLTAIYAKNRKIFNKRNMQGGALALSVMLLFTGAYMNAPQEVSKTDVDVTPARTAGVF